MRHSITATEAARRFSDLLNRVRYREESFVIERGGEAVGQLIPPPRKATLKTLLDIIEEFAPFDDAFADDLEEIRKDQPPIGEDPWRS